MKKTLLKWTLPVALVAALSSCGGEKTEEKTNTPPPDTSATTNETPDSMETHSFMLPSPLRIAYLFKQSGMKYYAGLTNAKDNAKKYSTNFAQSLALGVYSSDMAYNVLNKQKDDAVGYLKLVKDLSDKIGISNVFDSESLMDRFEKNIEKEDSIMFIVSELQSKTDEFLDNNNRRSTAAVIFSGAWVESMYLGSKSAERSKDKKFYNQVLDQLGTLETLINILKREKQDASISGLVEQLNSIKGIYDNFAGVKSFTGDRSEIGHANITVTDEELNTLSKKLEEIRTKFVNG